jgi:hypothetical protein
MKVFALGVFAKPLSQSALAVARDLDVKVESLLNTAAN